MVQIDNLTLLTRSSGVDQTAALRARLSAGIGAALRIAPMISLGGCGRIATVVEVSDAEVAQIRRKLTAVIRGAAGASPQMHASISGVMVRGAPGTRDDTMLDLARRQLATGTAGDLALIDTPGPTGPALDPAWIEPYYQPQLCCHSGAVTGFELLARVNHPVHGLMGPSAFLPTLSCDDQRMLTRLMLSRGLQALPVWAAAGFDVATLSLNVTNHDLRDPQFADFVLWELDRQDTPPNRLVIEVMEEMAPLDLPEYARNNLVRLAHLGCAIDLDDFGTGYASLEALRRLPIRRIKIDRSFVAGCDHDPGQQRMILGILALADRLAIDALAEGVETAAEHAFVAQIGCSHVQGYAIAQPLALAETLSFLAARRALAARMPQLRRSA